MHVETFFFIVKYECSSLNENQVTLNYIGIAVEVAFADQTNTECLFTPVDDKYDNFTLTVGLGNANSTSNVSNPCNFTVRKFRILKLQSYT